MSNADKQYAMTLLARRMYRQLCDFKGIDPWKYPYVDSGSIDYANLSIEYLGYTEDSINKLEDYLMEAGDLK